MSIAVTVSGFKPSFRRRLLGFDERQVLAFCAQVIDDYDRTLQELDRSRQELHVALEGAAEARRAETALQGVERILVSAQRIADEIENGAKGEATRLLAEASTRAVDLVKDAERRAAVIVEGARHEVARVSDQLVAMRTHYAELRAAFELAADTAASALHEIAGQERRPASQEAECVRA